MKKIIDPAGDWTHNVWIWKWYILPIRYGSFCLTLSNLYLSPLSKQLKFSVLPLILPVFPSWVDEIAKSRPDMNIKVTAFTESEKWSNTRWLANNKSADHSAHPRSLTHFFSKVGNFYSYFNHNRVMWSLGPVVIIFCKYFLMLIF